MSRQSASPQPSELRPRHHALVAIGFMKPIANYLESFFASRAGSCEGGVEVPPGGSVAGGLEEVLQLAAIAEERVGKTAVRNRPWKLGGASGDDLAAPVPGVGTESGGAEV